MVRTYMWYDTKANIWRSAAEILALNNTRPPEASNLTLAGHLKDKPWRRSDLAGDLGSSNEQKHKWK